VISLLPSSASAQDETILHTYCHYSRRIWHLILPLHNSQRMVDTRWTEILDHTRFWSQIRHSKVWDPWSSCFLGIMARTERKNSSEGKCFSGWATCIDQGWSECWRPWMHSIVSYAWFGASWFELNQAITSGNTSVPSCSWSVSHCCLPCRIEWLW